jgi:hypothetical protein
VSADELSDLCETHAAVRGGDATSESRGNGENEFIVLSTVESQFER